jgi:hypothetical protein
VNWVQSDVGTGGDSDSDSGTFSCCNSEFPYQQWPSVLYLEVHYTELNFCSNLSSGHGYIGNIKQFSCFQVHNKLLVRLICWTWTHLCGDPCVSVPVQSKAVGGNKFWRIWSVSLCCCHEACAYYGVCWPSLANRLFALSIWLYLLIVCVLVCWLCMLINILTFSVWLVGILGPVILQGWQLDLCGSWYCV